MDERPHAAALQLAPELLVLVRLPGRQRPASRIADEDLERLAAEQVGLRQSARDEALADLDMGPIGLRWW